MFSNAVFRLIRAAAISCFVISPLCFAEQPWVSLFNGKNLEGLTPKTSGHAPGANPFKTCRVEDGILKASYEGYGNWIRCC